MQREIADANTSLMIDDVVRSPVTELSKDHTGADSEAREAVALFT